MQAYTNRFDIIVSSNKSEVMINFSQIAPAVRDPSEDVEGAPAPKFAEDATPVANLVMTGQCARNLANLLLSLLDRET